VAYRGSQDLKSPIAALGFALVIIVLACVGVYFAGKYVSRRLRRDSPNVVYLHRVTKVGVALGVCQVICVLGGMTIFYVAPYSAAGEFLHTWYGCALAAMTGYVLFELADKFLAGLGFPSQRPQAQKPASAPSGHVESQLTRQLKAPIVASHSLAFNVAGIPVLLHWTILLWLAACMAIAQSIVTGLIAFACMCILMVAHELGHAVCARFLGLRVLAIEFNAVHGRCWHEAPRYPIEYSLVAWGGVLAQMVLLAAFAGLYWLVLLQFPAYVTPLIPVFVVFVFYNAALVAVNLYPQAPLDGHRAWPLVRQIINGELGRYLRWRRNLRAGADLLL
jgi:Zn-dependent protease